MRKLILVLLLLSVSAFAQGVGTVFFQASYTQSLGTVATPSFDNDTGSYSGSVIVAISDSDGSASKYYCTATMADCTPGTAYSSPVSISVDGTHLCANATKSGYTTSATRCATYTITTVSLPVSDSFAGSGLLSASWTTVSGSPVRSSGFSCGAWATCMAKYVGVSFPNDQWAELTEGAIGSSQATSAFVRMSGTSDATLNGYALKNDAGTMTLLKWASGTDTWKAGCGTAVSGHTYRIGVVGTTITGYDNGNAISGCTFTDSGYTSGTTAVRLACSGTCPAITNFQAD